MYQLKIEYCWVVEETTATLKLARAEKVTMMYDIQSDVLDNAAGEVWG